MRISPDKTLTITYRNEEEADVEGNVATMPFSVFYVTLRIEMSHFELDINNKHYYVRYIYSKHPK